MAPYLQPLSSSPRQRAWLIAALAAMCCALAGHGHSWAATDAGASSKSKKRPPTGTRASVAVAAPAPPPARSLPVYACQDAAGRTSYGQQPCADPAAPTSRQLAWQDTRKASQVAHSSHMQAREHRLLQTIERNRQSEAQRAKPARRTREHGANDTPTATPRPRAAPQPARYRVLPPLTAETAEQVRLKP